MNKTDKFSSASSRRLLVNAVHAENTGGSFDFRPVLPSTPHGISFSPEFTPAASSVFGWTSPCPVTVGA
jgi:hypothetical protein